MYLVLVKAHMKKLKIILSCSIIFILLLSIIYTILKVNIPKQSIYKENETEFIGNITKINYQDDRVIITIKNKEQLSGTYYLKENEKINLRLNDKVKIIGTLSIPNSNTIFNLFDYKEYLYNNNQYYVININKIIKIKDNSNILYKLKNNIISYIDNFKSKEYLHTFILGNTKYIDDDIINSYRNNGISHLFSVSGMHISFLSTMILDILKRFKLKENMSYILVILFLLFYTFLVSFTPSVNRSIILYILILIKKKLKLDIKNIYLLLLDLSILLFINPFYIYNIGFIYSFTISFYLILLQNKLNSKNYLLSIFKVSLISFIVSLPITIYNYYQINILSIIYNLLFVPIISLIIFPLSFIVIFIPILDNIYLFLINIVNNISLFIDNIDICKLILCKVPLIFILIYYIFITLSFYKKKYILILFIIILIHYNINNIYLRSYITFIDVGQGDSILLYSNNKTMLIDSGNNIKNNDENIITYLKSLGIKKLNYMLITHGDLDHLGNSKYILENYKVDNLYINNNNINDNEKEIIKNNSYKKYKEKEIIKLNDFTLLNLNKSYTDENDSSMFIYVKINNYKILLTGDSSVKTERYIIGKYNIKDIDILKVGHHGSKTSTSKELINNIKPKYSVISVGKNNRYNHPNREVLENLNNSIIYRTDINGSIMFKIMKNKLVIKTCLKENDK